MRRFVSLVVAAAFLTSHIPYDRPASPDFSIHKLAPAHQEIVPNNAGIPALITFYVEAVAGGLFFENPNDREHRLRREPLLKAVLEGEGVRVLDITRNDSERTVKVAFEIPSSDGTTEEVRFEGRHLSGTVTRVTGRRRALQLGVGTAILGALGLSAAGCSNDGKRSGFAPAPPGNPNNPGGQLAAPVFSSQPQSLDGGPNFAFNVTLSEPQAATLFGNLIPVGGGQTVPVNVIPVDGQSNFNGLEEYFITVPANAPGSQFILELTAIDSTGNLKSVPVNSQPFTVTQRGNFSGSPAIVSAATLQGTNTVEMLVKPTNRAGVRTIQVEILDSNNNPVLDNSQTPPVPRIVYSNVNLDPNGNVRIAFALPSTGTFNLRVSDFAPNLAYSNTATATVTAAVIGSALQPVTITSQPTNPNGDLRIPFVYDTGAQQINAQSAAADLINAATGTTIASGLNVVTTNGIFNPQGVNDAFVDLMDPQTGQPLAVPLGVDLVLDVFIGGQGIVPSPKTRTAPFRVSTTAPLQGTPGVVATVLSNGAGQTTNNIRLDITPNANNQDIRTYEISYFDAAGNKIGQTEFRPVPMNAGVPIAGTLIVAVPTTSAGSFRIDVKSSGPDVQPSAAANNNVTFSTVGSVLAAPLITQQPANPNGDLNVAFQIDSNNAAFPIQSGRARLLRAGNPNLFEDLNVIPANGTFTASGPQLVYIQIPATSQMLIRNGGVLQPTDLQFDLVVGGNGLPDSPPVRSAQFTVNRDTTTLPAPGITVTALQNTNTLAVDFVPNTNDPLAQTYHVQAFLGGVLQAEAFIPVVRNGVGTIVNSTGFILVPQLGSHEVRVSTFGPDIQNSPLAVQLGINVAILGTALTPVVITAQPNPTPVSRNVSFQFRDTNAAITTETALVEVIRPAIGGNPEVRQFVNVAYSNPGGVYLPNAVNNAFVTIPASMFLRDAGGNALPTTFVFNIQVGGNRIVPSNPVTTNPLTVATDQSPIVTAPTVTPVVPPGGQFFTNFTLNVAPNTVLTGVTNYHVTVRQGGVVISETFPPVAKDALGVPITSDINLTVPAIGLYDISVEAFGPDILNGPAGTAQVNVTQATPPFPAPTVVGNFILNIDGPDPVLQRDSTLTAPLDIASLGTASHVAFRATLQGQPNPLPDIFIPVGNIRPNGETDFQITGVPFPATLANVQVAAFHASVGLGAFTTVNVNNQGNPIGIQTDTLFAAPTNLSVQNNAGGPNIIDVIFNPQNPVNNIFAGDSNVAVIRVDVAGRPPMFFFPSLASGIPQGGGNLLFTVALPAGMNAVTANVSVAVGHPRMTNSAFAGPAAVNVIIASAAAGDSRRDFLNRPLLAMGAMLGMVTTMTDEQTVPEKIAVTRIVETPAAEDGPGLLRWMLSKWPFRWLGSAVLLVLFAGSAQAADGSTANSVLLLASAPYEYLFYAGLMIVAVGVMVYSLYRWKNMTPEEGEAFIQGTKNMFRRLGEHSGFTTRRKRPSGRSKPPERPIGERTSMHIHRPPIVEFSI